MIRNNFLSLRCKTKWGKNKIGKKVLASTFLIIVFFVFQAYTVIAQGTADYVWKNAPIGGGGFVTGIVTHPTSGERYCRTDVGGAYRWDTTSNEWIQLLDWFNESENGFYGVESLALDPQNPNNIYMLCGTSYINNGRTAILKSTDKGNTFTYTDVSSQFKAHGNGSGRGNGERLVVDPNNSSVLFAGTRANGLWKSTDTGVTWNQVWTGVTTTSNGNGICFVLFDSSSNVVSGVTQTMYIGVSRTGGGNIYKSTDGGANFTDISATTTYMPHRVALQGTTMYVTYSDTEGPATNGYGNVYKLNTATGVWIDVTPSSNKNHAYGGVSIDPTNVDRVVVSTCGVYQNNQFGTGWGDFIFITTDGGSNWTLKNGNNATYNANGMGWSDGGAVNWMDCVEFDQSNTNIVRVIGGGGIYTSSDITATNPSWKYDVIGIEETALLDGISVPGGPFISSFGDVTGFVHEPLTAFPSTKLSPLGGFNNNSIAYAGANPNKIVRIANEGAVVYYSDDMGASWTASATNMGTAGRVSISADGGTILHCPWGSTTTYYTTNNGGSWSSCSGVSLSDAAPVADQVNSNYFYILHPSTGQMYRSSDKGASFSVAGTPGASTANHPWESVLIRTVPGFEGHIWVPLGRNGLRYSTDHGATYTNLSSVTYCKSIGIGKAISGASYPTVFIWGTVSGVTGLFRSTDQGASWLRINDDDHEFGGAPFLIGDKNVEGKVYQAPGGGRGLIYWEPALSPCTPSTITSYVQIDGGSWQQTTSASLSAGDSVMFSPQPDTGGTWSWSGPNGFTASTREITISNIQANQAGDYVATYTNAEGCQSIQSITVTVCTPTAIIPYVQIDGGTWQQTANDSVTLGGSVIFGPQPATGGSWSWSGPNGFTASTREVTISNIQANQAGEYVATYTNDGGCQSTQSITVTVCTPTAIIPYVQIDGGTWQQTANDSVTTGGSVMFSPQPETGVSWSWSGPNGFTASTREVTISNIQANQAGEYVATYTNDGGCQSTQVYNITLTSAVTGTILEAERILNNIIIYPNPTSDGKFTITLPEITENVTISLSNMQGKLLYQKDTEGLKQLGFYQQLNAGIYLLRVSTNKFFVTKKLVVN